MEGPLPVRDVWSVYAEFIGMVLTLNLLVEQAVSNTGCHFRQMGYAVDGVDGEAKTVGLVADGQLQWRIDISLFLVTAQVNMMLAQPPIS